MATHGKVITELADHLHPILEHSPDGVYLWLDEENKTCNAKLAEMFGYTVPEWEAVDDFAGTFIAERDRGLYVHHYQSRVGELRNPVTFAFRGVRQDGTEFDAETDMIPLTYDGHVIAYHFVRKL